MSEHHCQRDDCPFQEVIGALNKTVFIGNGTPALTVQISNLATKMDTTRNLVLAAMVIIPVLLLLFQWGARAIGIAPVSAAAPMTLSHEEATQNATLPKAR